jgi:hypothetical protein
MLQAARVATRESGWSGATASIILKTNWTFKRCHRCHNNKGLSLVAIKKIHKKNFFFAFSQNPESTDKNLKLGRSERLTKKTKNGKLRITFCKARNQWRNAEFIREKGFL